MVKGSTWIYTQFHEYLIFPKNGQRHQLFNGQRSKAQKIVKTKNWCLRSILTTLLTTLTHQWQQLLQPWTTTTYFKIIILKHVKASTTEVLCILDKKSATQFSKATINPMTTPPTTTTTTLAAVNDHHSSHQIFLISFETYVVPYTVSIFLTATETVFTPLEMSLSMHFQTIRQLEYLNLFCFNPLSWQVNCLAGFDPPIPFTHSSYRTTTVFGHLPSTARSATGGFPNCSGVLPLCPPRMIQAGATYSAWVILSIFWMQFLSWADLGIWKSSISVTYVWVELILA